MIVSKFNTQASVGKDSSPLTESKSSAPALPVRKNTDEFDTHIGFNSSAAHHPEAGSSAKLTTPKSWDNNGDLWPGRSEIQEVAQGVCITNFFGAKKLPSLVASKITHVLVCANELPEAFPHSFQYLKLKGFTDNTGTDLAKQLDVALPWIEKAIREGGRVLLHCATGSSRSGSVMVAYLMHSQNLSLQDALELARRARPIIKPNPGFLEQLKEWSLQKCAQTIAVAT